MEESKSSRKIVMFPWLGFGHISPYVELAKKLSQNNFQIFLCSSPVNLQSIHSKLPSSNNSIQLIELNLPSPPELPPHLHTTNGLPLRLNSTLHKAFDLAAPQFHSILLKLNPHLLITETNQPWAVQSASSLDIPVVSFIPIGAGTFSYSIHAITNPGVEFPSAELDFRNHWFSRTFENVSEDSGLAESIERFVQWVQNPNLCADFILVNSFREMEGKYIDYLSVLMGKKVIPVGPLIQEVDEKSDWMLEWLDERAPKSTVYVSFGSEYFLSKREMEEVGSGLEMSGANFIWVVRFPKGEEMEIGEALPYGFMGRVGEKGIVVRGWVPQRKILNHTSVGGFVSHCGWSSVMEAVVSGIPIIALPMQLDQPCNAKVVAGAGVAVEADRGADGAVTRDGVANAVKKVLFVKQDFYGKGKQICKKLKTDQDQNIEACVAELGRLCESRPLC